MGVVGLLLAAGRGSRMGQAKALVSGTDGKPWVISARETMLAGGCERVVTVLGAEADQASALVKTDYVIAQDWHEGMSASLRAGLHHIDDGEAVLIHLVDIPDVGADVVRRIVDQSGPDALARASYSGTPGHPVLIGKNHWSALLAELDGDKGARDYLSHSETTLIECSDLATGQDFDSFAENL